ncbi:MAG TPA: glucoamylase family protein [Acidobacteriaceae bacterium]
MRTLNIGPTVPRSGITRRSALQLLAGTTAAATLPRGVLGQAKWKLSRGDDALLDDMERRAALYFWEQADPANGQVLDRADANNTDGKLRSRRPLSSIAATGFGLSTLCIADHRNYFPHDGIVERVRTTLDFHLNKLPNDHGFFSHFNDVHSGKAANHSEISSIDTSLLLCGVLTARAHFNDAKITDLATKLYERVEWPWMLNGGETFSMGFRDGAFIKSRWNHYCELMMLYLLAIGSPTHPVAPGSWDKFTRPRMVFQKFDYISAPDPLFVHQYSHAWFDFRNKRDSYADYFANSIIATRAHKAFCLSLKMGYTDDYWGVTASDSAHGYVAWGGPPALGHIDGTVVPCAAAGSLPFLPEDCLRVLQSLRKMGDQVYGRYSFRDAVHPAANWYDADVLGIDLGISALMAENLRTGFVWSTFMRNPEAARAMKLVGFRQG